MADEKVPYVHQMILTIPVQLLGEVLTSAATVIIEEKQKLVLKEISRMCVSPFYISYILFSCSV
jgi:hypothetical protein